MTTKDRLPRKTEKPWGFELLFARTEQYVGKLIFIRRGCRLSLQYHQEKDESMYIYEGRVILEVEDNEGQMASTVARHGCSVRIPPLTKHRLEALEDTTIFEVSTSELEDVKRLKDDYGRA